LVVSAVNLDPNCSTLAHVILPVFGSCSRHLLYWYFAVGIFSALLMEDEVHFYSSGVIEEDWKKQDLGVNFMVAAFGSLLGALITVGLLALGAIIFLPRGIFPQNLSTTMIAGAFPFGPNALI